MSKTFVVFERTARIESDEHGKYQRVYLKGIARNRSFKEAKDLRKKIKNCTIFPE